MPDETRNNLPADIANAVTNVVHALIPSSVKALNRLIGAGVEIPAAYLERISERTKAKTKSYVAVEEAVARAVSLGVEGDEETVVRAMTVLVAKEYRKQENREAIAREFLNDLQDGQPESSDAGPLVEEIDDDWLNVFERYAEDASTERMQKLWGRVLAGEVRKPGCFSMRTLRFLSEFSQTDVLDFSDFCNSSFAGIAPKALVKPDDKSDIRHLLNLEAAGLITGASGLGLTFAMNFSEEGFGFLVEDNLAIQFKSKPRTKTEIQCCVLTPLGKELIALLPARDLRAVARRVATAVKTGAISGAFLSRVDGNGRVFPFEVLWQEASTP